MNKELSAIKDAMDKTTGGGRDADTARKLADAYVAAHPDQFTGYDALDLPTLVSQVDTHRAAGDTDKQWLIEVFLLHRYEPQNIGGTYQPALRVTH